MDNVYAATPLVVLMFLASAFAVMCGTLAPDASASPEPKMPGPADEPVRGRGPGWDLLGTDWRRHADDEGTVSVIAWTAHGWQDQLPNRIVQSVESGKNADLRHVFPGFVARLPVAVVEEIIRTTDAVQFEPDVQIWAYATQIQYNATGADIVWNMTDGDGKAVRGNGTVVAVIDTGIDYNHADLGGGFGDGYRVTGGWDFVNNDADPIDDNGHGTHCAGIIGANGTVKGMAPDCTFLAYKVLGSGGTGSMSDAVLAIEMAMDPNGDDDTSDHADVLSLSFGAQGGTETSSSCLAVDAATAVGCVVSVAAGNEGPTFCTVGIPGKAVTAITVGSHGTDEELSSFSSRGMSSSLLVKPEISAPGESIYSTYLYGGYASMSGTSMACPHVSGAAALLVQAQPDWTPGMVKSAMVSRAGYLNESIWEAGAGKLWVGNATDVVVFSSPAILSGNRTFGEDLTLTITTTEPDVNLTTGVEDWHELTGNYTLNESRTWHPTTVDFAGVSPATTNPVYGVPSTVTLNITEPATSDPEGYYAGELTLANGSIGIRIPYAYAVVSVVEVHVYDLDGDDVYDPNGVVGLYDDATNTIVRGYTGYSLGYAPPVTAQLTSGNYTLHAMGHLLYYTYSGAYMLTEAFTVERSTDLDIRMCMADSRQFTLDLSTVDDHPMFLRDLRLYWRHIGEVNLSSVKEVTDYTYSGPELFDLRKRTTIFIDDTEDTVGVAVNAYGYSDAMYDFMERNYDHWYEYISGLSTDFEVIATADEQYMLAWEFEGVTGSTDTGLDIDWGSTVVYEVETDLPGTVTNPWLDYGGHRAIGGVAQFYPKKDTSTSLDPFFTGINKTVYVQGAQQLIHYPTTITGAGRSLVNLFEVDWTELQASTSANVYVPNRHHYTALDGENTTMSIGQGPLWVSASFNNTESQMQMFLPLLRESEHVAASPAATPIMNIYRGPSIIAYISLAEVSSTLPTKRVFSTATPGTYRAVLSSVDGGDVMSTTVTMTACWTTPSADLSPPSVTDFSIERGFTPGDAVPVSVTVYDDQSVGSVAIDWRNGSGDSWHSVSLTPDGPTYAGSVSTDAGTEVIDIRVNVTDATGNYLMYTIADIAKEEVAVSFELDTTEDGIPDIPYTNSEQRLTLYGHLTVDGSPVHSQAAVALDLTVDGVRVATLLDEYMDSDSHTHNGTIRFDWDFNPIHLFSGPGQSKEVVANFSLGIYGPVTATFTVNSTSGPDIPPVISLVSPANNSALVNGTVIDLKVVDEEEASVNYSLDGATPVALPFPYIIETAAWADGEHTLRVNATDSNTTSTVLYDFEVDTLAPVVSITYPDDMDEVEAGETVTISVSDNSSLSVHWSVDGGFWAIDYPTYGLSTDGWTPGWYNVTVRAYDQFGHYSEDEVQIQITSEAPLITDSPGTTGTVDVEYEYNATCTAADSGSNDWALTTNASWLSESWSDQTHCLVNGTPTEAGYFWANLTVNDTDTSDWVNWTVTVSGESSAPSITTTASSSAKEDFEYSYDADADQGVTWSLTTNASFLEVDESTGVVSGTPTNAHSARTYYANLSCSNANGTDYENWTVNAWNLAPAFTSSPGTTVTVYQEYAYDANHSDEGVGSPAGNFTGLETNYTGSYSFDEATGALSFTPTALGSYWFNITADDQRGVDNSTATQNWTVTVEAGAAPTVTTSAGTATGEDALYSYDADSDQAVTWSLATNASFLSVSSTTGVVSGTPTNAFAERSFYANLTCANINGTGYENFTLTVWNAPPVISTTPGTTATNGTAYSYDASHTDEGIGEPPGNYTGVATNYTGSYSFDEATGLLSLTPTVTGAFWFNITADDQRGAANSTTNQNWTLTVGEAAVEGDDDDDDDDDDTPSTTYNPVHATFVYYLSGATIRCIDQSFGPVSSRTWSFGDGATSTSEHTVHEYRSPGTYTVTLTVQDGDGHSSVASTRITVTDGSGLALEWLGQPESDGPGLDIDLASVAAGVAIVGVLLLVSSFLPIGFAVLTPTTRLIGGIALLILSGYIWQGGG